MTTHEPGKVGGMNDHVTVQNINSSKTIKV